MERRRGRTTDSGKHRRRRGERGYRGRSESDAPRAESAARSEERRTVERASRKGKLSGRFLRKRKRQHHECRDAPESSPRLDTAPPPVVPRPVAPPDRDAVEPIRRTRLYVACLLLAIGIGAVVRLLFLASHPMRYDEAYNFLHFVTQSPTFIATHYIPNNHVFHTLMVRAVSEVFGTSPGVLRIPAFVGGVLLIPASAWLAWSLSRRWVSTILAAIAVSVSAPLIEYSSNARGYSWLALFTTLTTLCTLHLIVRGSQRWVWIAWAVLTALGAYTIPVMVCPALGMTAAMLYHWRKLPKNTPVRRNWFRCMVGAFGVCGLLTLAMYIPILIVDGTSAFTRSTEMAYRILGEHVGSYGGMLSSVLYDWTYRSSVVWPWLLAIGLITFFGSALRKPTPQRLLPIFILGGALAAVTAMRAPMPTRTWLFALPLVLACAACGLDDVRERIARLWPSRIVAAITVSIIVILVAHPIVSVARQTYLSSELNGLVEIEDVLNECKAFGPSRCAVLARYTPAASYYMLQHKIDPLGLPDSFGVQRVFIVSDEIRSLGELWHSGVEGYDAFEPPQVWRKTPTRVVYLAERPAEKRIQNPPERQGKVAQLEP